MPVYLDSLAIQFYRGIGPDTQYIGPFSDLNFFIGPNNSGKSTVLNFIGDKLPFATKPTKSGLVDEFRGPTTGQTMSAIGIPREEFVERVRAKIDQTLLIRFGIPDAIERIVDKLIYKDFIWVHHGNPDQKPLYYHPPKYTEFEGFFHSHHWNQLWNNLTGQTGGAFRNHWVPQTIDAFLSIQHIKKIPEISLIPAKRQLGPKSETFDDLTGKGLIDHLAAIQNPDHHERERKDIFDKINEFVRNVTGKPDAQLEVPSSREHLLVHMDNKVLPLSSLGTGIHEVILIAAFCTINQNQIMCIEEPEIHLHPILQRKLVRYLKEHTANQYFIATHSAAFIDTPGAAIFRIHNDGAQTSVSSSPLKSQMRGICDDLGYRASDIMQSNAVVWVEGPSDRIYLKHWLLAFAPELIEGLHFSIMFYGGGLISHLSADDDAASEFIMLRELNRNLAIVVDSDKRSASAALKPAAQRIQADFSDGEGVAWITKGREIENYVRPELLHDALSQAHPKIYKEPEKTGPYDHAFYFMRKHAKKPEDKLFKGGDKVGAARIVCKQPAELDVLDLEQRISDVAAMIRKANDMGDQ